MSGLINTDKISSTRARNIKKIELSKEIRAELLRKAYILDANGDYLPQFFSAETIRKDKEFRTSAV